MTLKHALLTAAAGSALALAPVALATVAVPAVSHADKQPKCDEAAVADPAQPPPPCNQPAPQAQGQTLNCPDGTIVDTKYGKCVSLTDGIAKQLRALPAPPGLQGFGNAAGGGGGGLGGFNGIPSLGTINLPSVVLPSLGLGLVPDINLNFRPQF